MTRMIEMDDTKRFWLWLNYGTEYDTRRFRAVRARFPQMEEAYQLIARGNTAQLDFLPSRCLSRLKEAAAPGFLDRFTDMLMEKGIGVCLLDEPEYPALLRQIHDAPNVLYYRGKLVATPNLALAMVGARRASEYGKDVAEALAHGLVRAGAVVVSGMASGIDACAAKGALACKDADYPTVAVLGTGVDVVYPAGHERLYEEICQRGCVVSEFLPGTQARPQHFPIRNRIISGMSHGVVVVEAGERSGATITAGYALEEGREVFAVPGRITDATSIGTNRMICHGEAKPVCKAEDILEEYGSFQSEKPAFSGKRLIVREALPPEQQAVVQALSLGEQTVDQLCEKLSLPLGKLNSALTELMFSGIIKQLPGRVYVLDAFHGNMQ